MALRPWPAPRLIGGFRLPQRTRFGAHERYLKFSYNKKNYDRFMSLDIL
jgi:hypothetical protein